MDAIRRLSGFLAEAAGKPFVWGQHDCALFACDWIRRVTGHDPAAPFRGHYSSPEGAVEALRAFAGDLGATAARQAVSFGFQEISPAQARAGDVGLVWPPDGFARGNALMIRTTRGWAGLHPDRGVLEVPAVRVRRAWAIAPREVS